MISSGQAKPPRSDILKHLKHCLYTLFPQLIKVPLKKKNQHEHFPIFERVF